MKKKLFRRFLVFILILAWLFSGWPPIWPNSRIPLKVQNAWASSETFSVGSVVYTSSATWTVPTGVTSVIVETWGGGGAGGGNNQALADGAGGGGGGAYSKKVSISVTPGNNHTVTVGIGGTAVASSNGGAGGDSLFLDDDGSTVLVKAVGGGGGGKTTGAAGAAGIGGSAAACIGDEGSRFSGGNGGAGENSSNGTGGGGGGSGSQSGTGNSGTAATVTGAVAKIGGGPGGYGYDIAGSGLAPVIGPGGGGGGSGEGATAKGGSGYSGRVRITYLYTWTAPTGVTSVTVETWGGGGGGGGQNRIISDGGGGGGGGAYAKKVGISVSPENGYTVVAGAGGLGGTCLAGLAGEDSYFIDSSTVMAKGGSPGANSTGTPPAGGAGGAAGSSVGDGGSVFSGGNGGKGADASAGYGAPGGSSAGTLGVGTSGPPTYSTSTAGSPPSGGGIGGNGGASLGSNGNAPASGNGGGGGGGAEAPSTTSCTIGGAGVDGKIIITYNTSPSFSSVPVDTDPVDQGQNVTFTATVTDSESDSWYLTVCKTNSVTAGTPPTCETDQTYCVSSSAVASNSENTCVWTSTGSGEKSWYAFACDNNSLQARCSAANTTNSPVTVNAVVISVSIITNASIAYGIVGTSKSTIDLGMTPVARNEGNVPEKFRIQTSIATNGTSWGVGATAGENIFVHEFSTNGGGLWTKLTAADSYQDLATGVGVGGTQPFDLRITVPTETGDYQEKTIYVTILAVQQE